MDRSCSSARTEEEQNLCTSHYWAIALAQLGVKRMRVGTIKQGGEDGKDEQGKLVNFGAKDIREEE